MLPSTLSVLALSVLAMAMLPALPATAEMPRTITVAAQGSISAEPDMASIQAGVTTEAATAKDALAQNSATMRKVLDGLRAKGIAAKDIQTSRFGVQPRYEQRKDGRPPRVVGYQVSNQVIVVVRDLKSLGELIDHVISLGANRFDGIEFGISDIEAKTDAARRDAMQNAIRRAKLYAEAAGATLGPVLVINEGGRTGGGPQPYRRERAVAMSAPVAPGELEVEVQVEVTWALK